MNDVVEKPRFDAEKWGKKLHELQMEAFLEGVFFAGVYGPVDRGVGESPVCGGLCYSDGSVCGDAVTKFSAHVLGHFAPKGPIHYFRKTPKEEA